MFHFSIRDILWLTALVGMGAAWWAQHQDMLAKHSALLTERNDAQNEHRRLAADHKMLADDWKLLVWSLEKLHFDAAHLVSAAHIADRYAHRRYKVLIEPTPPLELRAGQLDFIF